MQEFHNSGMYSKPDETRLKILTGHCDLWAGYIKKRRFQCNLKENSFIFLEFQHTLIVFSASLGKHSTVVV